MGLSLGKILKVAAPVAGFALGGPLGAGLGSAIAGGVSGAENSAKAGKLTKQQNAIAMGNWNDTAPLRSKALQMALAPRAEREDTSALFADPGNPYSRTVPRPAAAAPPPAAPPPVAPPPPTNASRGLIVPDRPASGTLGKALGSDTQRFGASHPLIQRLLAKQQAQQSGPSIGPDGLVRQ